MANELIERLDTDLTGLNDLATEVNKLHKEFLKTAIRGAQIAFEIGEMLEQKHSKDGIYAWEDWCKKNLIFSRQTRDKYTEVYYKFRDHPEFLKDKTQTEALVLAGLAKPNPQAKGEHPGRIGCMGDDQSELPFDNVEALFEKPCLAKVELKNYRIEPVPEAGRVWLISRDGAAVVVAQLYAQPPLGMDKKEVDDLYEDVQKTFERFYARVEQAEQGDAV